MHIGTAGIPLQCKDGSTLEGVECVHRLGLDAMEVQFVRGVNMKPETAEEVGIKARELDVKLSIHAPYYINLASHEKQKIAASKKRILDSAVLAGLMGARVVVFHPGYYGKRSREETAELVAAALLEIRGKLREEKVNVLLGPETTGRQKQYGSLEEILELCRQVEDTIPVLDFGHLHARGDGALKSRKDFAEILDRVENQFGKKFHFHIHMAGNYYTKGNERHHLTIDHKEPDYSLLAKELVERKTNATIISESPNIEIDALEFKRMLGV